MKFFTTKEAWIWVLASLVVINMAIIGTMLWQRYNEESKLKSDPEFKAMPDRRPSERGFGRWHEEMGFTEEQGETLKEMRDEFRKSSAPIFSEMQENQQQIFEELEKESPDQQKLEMLTEITGQLHAEMRRATIGHMLAIKSVTTPGQYEKMAEMMQQWMFPGPMQRNFQRPNQHQHQYRHGPDRRKMKSE